MRTKKLTRLALAVAAALAIFVIEAQIPPVIPVPGVKLGLSNIVTLCVMARFGRREAFLVLFARILLGAMFAGGVSSLLFSAAGGLLAWSVMALTIGAFDSRLIWVVSVFGALAHNAGQLAVAVLVTGTASILLYFPALLASGIVTGVFTGLAAGFLLKRLA